MLRRAQDERFLAPVSQGLFPLALSSSKGVSTFSTGCWMTNMAQALASLEITTPATIQTDAAPPWSGIRGRIVAVLEDAIHSLKSPQGIVRNAAEQWIDSGERRYVFSFAAICETLEFEPIAIRLSVINPQMAQMAADPRRRAFPPQPGAFCSFPGDRTKMRFRKKSCRGFLPFFHLRPSATSADRFVRSKLTTNNPPARPLRCWRKAGAVLQLVHERASVRLRRVRRQHLPTRSSRPQGS
jgi:hypothetical protein